jgi:hypothetical protein
MLFRWMSLVTLLERVSGRTEFTNDFVVQLHRNASLTRANEIASLAGMNNLGPGLKFLIFYRNNLMGHNFQEFK